MSPQPGRLVASHALAAVAMAMPWPALLAATWSSTHSEIWLGVAGAARMAPYVALSWLAGTLGDRMPRLRLLRVATVTRALLLVGCAVLLGQGLVLAAVVAATLVVAVGTPAYPALAAAMPRLAGHRTEVVTGWLVTVEVAAFVVGPALGGLLLGPVGAGGTAVVAAVVGATAVVVLPGTAGDARPDAAGRQPAGAMVRQVAAAPGALRAVATVAGLNAVLAAAALGLLPLAMQQWDGGSGDFGLATAALGFGALAAPVLYRFAPGLRAAAALTATGLVGVALSPTMAAAVVPLALAGTAGTRVECAATAVIQHAVPDRVRAFALGMTDTAMVTAAMVAAAAAPWLAGALGPRPFFACWPWRCWCCWRPAAGRPLPFDPTGGDPR